MKTLHSCAATLVLVGVACSGAASSTTAAMATMAPAPMRGATGDTVRVIINHVSADKRAQFEHFAHDILAPAMAKVAPSDPATARQLRQARLLAPTRLERDSTWSYVFIVDPVVTSRSYSFPELLTKAYGAEKANEYLQLFREALARPQETYLVTNAGW